MAFKLGELVWEITGDNTGAKKALAQTEKGIKKTSKETSKLGKVFKAAFAVAIVAAIAKAGKALIKAGSDAEETANKFGVVFDSVIDEANEMANVLATEYGLARQESQDLLSATGDLLVGFGVSKKAALDLSFQVTALGADLASFSNFSGGAAGAANALRAALLGETEQAKQLGLALNETALRAYAEGQGLVFKSLTQNEKMFLRMELAVSQSQSAIGDFNRSIDSFANQTRIADSRAKDLTATYGKALLPMATLAVKAFNANAEAMQDSADAFANFVTSSQGASQIGAVIGTIAGAFAVLKEVVMDILKPFEEVGDALDDAFRDLSQMFPAATKAGTGFSVLSVVVTALSLVFKLLALSIAGGIELMVNMTRVIVDTASIFSAFYEAMSGKGSWKDLDDQIRFAGNAYKKLGKDAVETGKKMFDTFTEGTKDMGENADAAGKKMTDTFNRTYDNTQKKIHDVLTAQQQLGAAGVDAADETEKGLNSVNKAYEKAKENQSEFAKLFGQGSQSAFESFTAINDSIKDIATTYQVATSQIIGALQAVDQYQKAVAARRIGELDAQEQAELEAAGVAEESAVEAAQRELDLAEETGSEEEKQEAKNALKKAQIEEKFAKKKAEIEYKSALQGWEIQKVLAAIQLVAAPLNAYVSSLTAPWPLNMILAPINAALAAATAGIQYAAVVQAKPQKPSFQFGGIVPGSSFSGDNVSANVNSGEMVLTQQQQGQLFNQANGGGGGGNLRPERAVVNR